MVVVERGVEDRDLRHVGEAPRGRPGCRRGSPGCAAAPAGISSSMAARTSSVTTTGSLNRSPPCTTRWPTATRPSWSRPARGSRNASATTRQRLAWSAMRPFDACASARQRSWRGRRPALADPLDDALASADPVAASSSWYFSDDDPALRTRTGRDSVVLRHDVPSRLDRGDRDGVDDVLDQRTAGQVVDRLAQALQHRPDRHGAGAALHRLVGVVAGVEVGEDQHGGAPGDGGVRQLGRRDGHVDRRVVLDRALDRQVRRPGRGPARSRRGPCRRRRRCRRRRSSTTASRPAARSRTAPRSPPTRSRCRRAARRWGRG